VRTAQEDLREALLIAHVNGDLPVILEILIAYARYYFQTGNAQNGARLAAIVDRHPALNSQVREMRLDPLLAELERALPPDELAAALAEAEHADTNAVVEGILGGAALPGRNAQLNSM
jgi:hypothetical protein